MADIKAQLRGREFYRKENFPIIISKEDKVPITLELFKKYYYSRFAADLQNFYSINLDQGDRTFHLIKTVANHHQNMLWHDIRHFYMFSVCVFLTSLFAQVIGRIFGWRQMENFLRASSWPMLNCGSGGLLHPIQVIFESGLFPLPKKNFDIYYDALHIASEHLSNDFLEFLVGQSPNANNQAYRDLCNGIQPNIITNEIKTQVNLFEKWIGNPETRYPAVYVKNPKEVNNPESSVADISTYLSEYKEPMPKWLEDYNSESEITFADIMSKRVGYYPGSEFDGSLIKIVNKSHAVHSFLYVDYGVTKKELTDHLSLPKCVSGYHSIGRIEWKEKDLLPSGRYPTNDNIKPEVINERFFIKEKPYYITEIFERNEDRGQEWGSKRFAVTFLFADGINTYFQIFCKEYKKAPWIFLLQDHGTGGNYDHFGKGGILDAIAKKNNTLPEFILCAQNSIIWDQYDRVIGLPAVKGGMHMHERLLFKHKYQYGGTT